MKGSQLVGVMNISAGGRQTVNLDVEQEGLLGLTSVATYQYKGTKTGTPVFADAIQEFSIGDELVNYLPIKIGASQAANVIQMLEPGAQTGVFQDATPSAADTDTVAVHHYNGPFTYAGYTKNPKVTLALRPASCFGASCTDIVATVEIYAVYGSPDAGRYITIYNDPNSLQIHKADSFGPSNSILTRMAVIPGTTTTYVDGLDMTPLNGVKPVSLARKNGPRALYSVWADAALSNKALVERIDAPRFNGQQLEITLSTTDSVIGIFEARVPSARQVVATTATKKK